MKAQRGRNFKSTLVRRRRLRALSSTKLVLSVNSESFSGLSLRFCVGGQRVCIRKGATLHHMPRHRYSFRWQIHHVWPRFFPCLLFTRRGE